MSEKIDVLLVDDDADICIMMESILKFSGYSVRYSSSPEKLNALLREISPSLIVIDMFLSGMDGREICKKLKSDEATRDIRVMMMSAHPDAEVTCFNAGADEFLPKPFDIDPFINKVRAILKH